MYEIGEHKRSSFFSRRMGRREYWTGIGILAGLGILLALLLPSSNSSGTGFVWLIFYGWRLHDIGRSAWWAGLLLLVQTLILLLAAMVAWDGFVYLFGDWSAQSDPAPPKMFAALGAILLALLLQIAFTIWLGLRPGDSGNNRFGPPPKKRRLFAPAA
jgi:uncharacterized membrane protein YhaH (DUF805 family)